MNSPLAGVNRAREDMIRYGGIKFAPGKCKQRNGEAVDEISRVFDQSFVEELIVRGVRILA